MAIAYYTLRLESSHNFEWELIIVFGYYLLRKLTGSEDEIWILLNSVTIIKVISV